jgi:hypothetical protein
MKYSDLNTISVSDVESPDSKFSLSTVNERDCATFCWEEFK